MRFPPDGSSYFAGWRPKKALSDADIADGIVKLETGLLPAQRGAMIIALTRLAAHFWGERPETQWKIIFEDYTLDLAEIPHDIFEAGIVAWRRKGKWWPKVSELISEMRGPLSVRRQQLDRLRQYAAEAANRKNHGADNGQVIEKRS